MGRHAAPEGRHRRSGALLAQAGLVAVLALVAVSVLFGSLTARDTVDGTFTAAPESAAESAQESAAAPPGTATPDNAAGPSTARSAPASRSAASAPAEEPAAASTASTARASGTVTPEPSSDRVVSPESWGVDATAAPTTSPRAADTTAPSASSPAASATATSTPTSTPEKFATCDEAKAAGVSMIPSTDPRYAPGLDHDGDGVACDRHGDPATRHQPSPPATPPATPSICPTP